jgi:hypothetical protein
VSAIIASARPRLFRSKSLRWAVLTGSLLFTGQSARSRTPSQVPTVPQRDLTQVSMEGLMDLEVTSASKKEQKLSQVPAALFAITQESRPAESSSISPTSTFATVSKPP